MQNLTTKKTSTIMCIALAVILVLASLFVLLPSFMASGAEIKTSKVYKSSDNVKFKGTENGTEATLGGKATGAFALNNTLYMNKYASDKDNFKLSFEIKSDNFTEFRFTFSTNNADEAKAAKVENKVEFKNEDDKLEVRAVSGLLKDSEQKAIAFEKTNVNFLDAKILLTYDAALTQFSVSINGGSAIALNKDSNTISFLENEAEMYMTFSGVDFDDNKVAKVFINSIGGQSMVEGTNGIVDTVEPLIIINETYYNKNADGEYLVGERTTVKLPIKTYDVLQQSLTGNITIKYTDEDTEEKIDSTASFYAKKTGKFTAKFKVPTGVDDKTIDKDFTFNALVDDAAPQIQTLSDIIEIYAPAGVKYGVKKPVVTDTLGIDTNENVTFTLWYMTPSSTEWTKSEGISFTPTIEGLYKIRLQAKDRSKNNSPASEIVEVYFADQDAPTLSISDFPKVGYLNEELSLPTGSGSDTVDSGTTKTIKVYFIKADGEEVEIELENNAFTPTELGQYKVIYTVKDKANFVTEEVKILQVKIDDRPKTSPLNEFFTPLTVTLICISAASLIGLVLLIVLKPKKSKAV